MISESISVRELVEFSYFAEDISSSNSILKMNEGSEGHRARQALLDEGFEAEVAISSTFEGADYVLKVSGRMDVFCGFFAIPKIEEIKLCDHRNPPSVARVAHMYQLYCYAAMLFQNNEELKQVDLLLNYVDVKGDSHAKFEESLGRVRAMELMQELVDRYIQFCLAEQKHQTRRNTSIAEIPFPFQEFRAGQREFAAQVFTAIKSKRNLYASLPTGTGKTIATLYPAIKAMNEGLCHKVLYLTARTAARQSPLSTMKMLIEQGLNIRVLVITAKEKACINDKLDCNPEGCPYAKGHFLREKDAILDIMQYHLWNFELIRQIALRHDICPFEFSLSLYYIADVVICDYNYVFDPFVVLQRAAEQAKYNTLLVDEAHHLLDRLRDGLSCSINTKELREYRVKIREAIDSKCQLYKSLSHLMGCIADIPVNENGMQVMDVLSDTIQDACEALKYSCADFFAKDDKKLKSLLADMVFEIYKLMSSACYALEHLHSGYKTVLESYRSYRVLHFYCLDPRFRILEATSGIAGTVYFSATFEPLRNMKTIFGGGDSDATFALPSPFPSENLLVAVDKVSTYYADRKETAPYIAGQILKTVQEKPGNYIVYLPSYEYLEILKEEILANYNGDTLVQDKNLDDSQKQDFIQQFVEKENLLGLCVLGGSFSEGIDLPGKQLVGVFVVGVGLSQPDFKTNLLKDYFEERYQEGYAYAYQIPAMQRVLQACGRVIRSETDRGIVVLFDKRYGWPSYKKMLPRAWNLIYKDISAQISAFSL